MSEERVLLMPADGDSELMPKRPGRFINLCQFKLSWRSLGHVAFTSAAILFAALFFLSTREPMTAAFREIDVLPHGPYPTGSLSPSIPPIPRTYLNTVIPLTTSAAASCLPSASQNADSTSTLWVLCEATQSCAIEPLFPNEPCGASLVPTAHTSGDGFTESVESYQQRTFAGLPQCSKGWERGRWLLRCPLHLPGATVATGGVLTGDLSRACPANISECEWTTARWQPLECSIPNLSIAEARECLDSVVLLAEGDSTLRGIINATLDIADLIGIDKAHSHRFWDATDQGYHVYYDYFPRLREDIPGVYRQSNTTLTQTFSEFVPRVVQIGRNATGKTIAAVRSRPRKLVIAHGYLYASLATMNVMRDFARSAQFLSPFQEFLQSSDSRAGSVVDAAPIKPLLVSKSRSLYANFKFINESITPINEQLRHMAIENGEIFLDTMQIMHGGEHTRNVDKCQCHFRNYDPDLPPGHRIGVPVNRETARLLYSVMCPRTPV